jgi:hypothetical protein
LWTVDESSAVPHGTEPEESAAYGEFTTVALEIDPLVPGLTYLNTGTEVTFDDHTYVASPTLMCFDLTATPAPLLAARTEVCFVSPPNLVEDTIVTTDPTLDGSAPPPMVEVTAIVIAAPALDGSVPPSAVEVATIPSLVEDAIVDVTPGFLENKTRLIICVPRKSTHMSE